MRKLIVAGSSTLAVSGGLLGLALPLGLLNGSARIIPPPPLNCTYCPLISFYNGNNEGYQLGLLTYVSVPSIIIGLLVLALFKWPRSDLVGAFGTLLGLESPMSLIFATNFLANKIIVPEYYTLFPGTSVAALFSAALLLAFGRIPSLFAYA